ncbi:hypothetical protein DRN85_01280 [Methanosarcinales archaeon]|nr:MAG: hypothetical protein DRN85_01280 [Methanosarcinales archaeon]RLG27766.1 MAG: hypothetical protein DRN70_01625 [Methanosarcinales archaeon]
MPRDACIFYVGGEKTLLGWFKVILIDRPGSLAQIPVVFADNGVDQLFGYFSLIQRGVKGKYVTFAELPGVDVEKLVADLQSLDEVLDVDYCITEKILIQTAEFPLEIFKSRAIILKNTTFIDIIEEIEEAIPNANALIFHCGLKGGMDDARYFKEVAGIKKNDFITLLRGVLFSAGWGIVDISFDFESCSGSIYVKNSFLAETTRLNEGQSQCGYLSGYFAGFFTEILEKDMEVHEEKCRSGREKICEFAILPTPEDDSESKGKVTGHWR